MLGEFLDAQPDPIWLASPAGALLWANAAWLQAVGARSAEEASRKALSLDGGVQALIAEAAAAGQACSASLRWTTVKGRRCALRITARDPCKARRWRCGRWT